MSKDRKISTLILIILVGFFVAVVYFYFLGVYGGLGYPLIHFCPCPLTSLLIFSRVIYYNYDLNPYLGPNLQLQYPFLNIVGYIFSLIPPAFAYLIFVLLVTDFLFLACIYSLRIENQPTNWVNVIILTLFTYPFLLDIDRGNFDGIIFIFLAIFMYFFMKKRFLVSAIFLSFAIALKPFPGILLLLFTNEKKYKEAAIAILFTLILTIFPLLVFKGGFLANFRVAISIPSFPGANSTGSYFAANNVDYRGMSLFTFIKFIFIEAGVIQNINMSIFSDIYFKSVLLVLIPIVLYVLFIEEILWKRVAILSIAMLIFPQFSVGYRLMYMFVPLFLFLMNAEESKFDYVYIILFGLLLIPKNYYIFPNIISDTFRIDFSVNEPINTLILVAMLLTIMISGIIKSKRFAFIKKGKPLTKLEC